MFRKLGSSQHSTVARFGPPPTPWWRVERYPLADPLDGGGELASRVDAGVDVQSAGKAVAAAPDALDNGHTEVRVVDRRAWPVRGGLGGARGQPKAGQRDAARKQRPDNHFLEVVAGVHVVFSIGPAVPVDRCGVDDANVKRAARRILGMFLANSCPGSWSAAARPKMEFQLEFRRVPSVAVVAGTRLYPRAVPARTVALGCRGLKNRITEAATDSMVDHPGA